MTSTLKSASSVCRYLYLLFRYLFLAINVNCRRWVLFLNKKAVSEHLKEKKYFLLIIFRYALAHVGCATQNVPRASSGQHYYLCVGESTFITILRLTAPALQNDFPISRRLQVYYISWSLFMAGLLLQMRAMSLFVFIAFKLFDSWYFINDFCITFISFLLVR